MKTFYDSELIELRAEARANKNWALSDSIRTYLDSRNVFIFDTKDGQEIHFATKEETRETLIEKMNKDIAAEKRFDSWLYSMLHSAKINTV